MALSSAQRDQRLRGAINAYYRAGLQSGEFLQQVRLAHAEGLLSGLLQEAGVPVVIASAQKTREQAQMTDDAKRAFIGDLTDLLVALNNERPTLPSREAIYQVVDQKLDAHLLAMRKITGVDDLGSLKP